LTFYLPSIMTADLAASLLNRAANGAELLQVLDSIADDVADANIADAAAHYAAISAPTAESIQF
jgi:cytochrome c553